MITHVFAVLDKQVAAYGPPFFARSLGEAKRSFIDACSPGQNTSFIKFPADYDLYYLGRFDDNTGRFEMEAEHPMRCMSALEAVAIVESSPPH